MKAATKTRFSLRLGLTVLLVLQAISGNAAAASLIEHTPPQHVVPGDTLRLVLQLAPDSPESTSVAIVDPLPDMSLTRMTRDKVLLQWYTPVSLTEEMVITVRASSEESKARAETHFVVVRSSLSRRPVAESVVSTASRIEEPLPQSQEKLAQPTIRPIPTQIVSAGSVVEFKVFAVLVDGQLADISMDRMPSNATFKEETVGSRTFRWKTSTNDGGEHRFVITATHPRNGDLQDVKEAVIIIAHSSGETEPDYSEPYLPEGNAVEASPPAVDPSLAGVNSEMNDPAGSTPDRSGAYFADDGAAPPDRPTDAPPEAPDAYFPTPPPGSE